MLQGRNMAKSTTNLILSIDMRGRRTSCIMTPTQSPVLPQVTDYRLPNYTACNHCLSDFHPQALNFWWPAFTFWAIAINTVLKWKLYPVTIFGLQDTQNISALNKGCYWKLLKLIKQNLLQHCLVFSLTFNPRSVAGAQREGIITLQVAVVMKRTGEVFPHGRLLESSPYFIWIFMVEAFGWWRGPQEKAGWPSGVHLDGRP